MPQPRVRWVMHLKDEKGPEVQPLDSARWARFFMGRVYINGFQMMDSTTASTMNSAAITTKKTLTSVVSVMVKS